MSAMRYLRGATLASGRLVWDINEHNARDKEEGVEIVFPFFPSPKKYKQSKCFKSIKQILEQNNISWLVQRYKEWVMDLDKFKMEFSSLSSINWLKGIVHIEPEFETEERISSNQLIYEAKVLFRIIPGSLKRFIPDEIMTSFWELLHPRLSKAL